MSTPENAPYKLRQHRPHFVRWIIRGNTETYRRTVPKAPSHRDRHRADVAARKALR